MITLSGQREIAGCSVFRDDVDPLVWYAIPQAPTIALDDRGKPIFSLVWYRRDLSRLTEEERRNKLGGGILACSVELAIPDLTMRTIKKALAEDPALHDRLSRENPARGPDYRRWWLGEVRRDENELAAALKIGAVPVADGTVSIAILGETSGEGGGLGEMVASLVGVGRVNMTGRQRASFMAKLTQDGAVLLWKMVEESLPAIRVAYDLKFHHRLDAVRMVVWAHAEKSYRALQDQWQRLNDNASWSERHGGGSSHYTFSRDQSMQARNLMSESLHASESSGVEIIPEGAPDALGPEIIEELTKSGNDMIRDFLAATFLEFKTGEQTKFDDAPQLETGLPEKDARKYGHHGIEQYSLKEWNESMRADLHHEYRTQAVMEGHLAPNDNLSNVLGGRRVEEFREQIDLSNTAFYDLLDVQVLCTADFDEDPVDLVKVHLDYSGRGRGGDILEVKDLAFQKNTPPGRFVTYLADERQRSYAWDLTVFYRGTNAQYTLSGTSEETILVLDTDRLGVLRVDVQLGLIDWERIRQVFVKMSYGAGADRKETEFTLDAQRQSKRWAEVIAREVTEPYHYTVTWVDKNNQRIVGEEQAGRSKSLVLNQPIGEELEVTVVPAGSFAPEGPVSQIIATLRYRDEANDYTVDDNFTFTKSGDTKTWRVPLVDKTRRSYEYRYTVIYSDGLTREDSWKRTDATILTPGDAYGMRVEIIPYLLRSPPGAWLFGTVQLLFEDAPSGVRAEKTLRIDDFAKPLTWRFRLGAPERHTYRYQLTLYRGDGREVKLPFAEETKEVLVLIPPT